jgi:GTP pyrophosphokinase
LDDVGVIKKITNIISDSLNINMRSISVDSHDGIFEGTIMVYVHDKEEFDHLCFELASLEGIITIERIETSE